MRSTSEKDHTMPPGNVYLVVWKVGMTRTCAKENEGTARRGFAGRI